MRYASVGMNSRATIILGFVLLFSFAQIAPAQTPLPLGLDNNYMVTGDYVVGGWTKTGSATVNNTLMSTGTIPIPDATAYGSVNFQQQVPAGADIVAAFLYWATVENSGTFAGQKGVFGVNGGNLNPITGTILGNPNAPVSWSSGGCAGASQGSKTMVAYRADVSPLLSADANGNIQPNATYKVGLPDTGKASQAPFALGATLVIVYRLLAPEVPLTAVVIYDGAYAPGNTSQVTTHPLIGFFQAGNDQGGAVVAKITHIVANGQLNKSETVTLNGVPLPSLYGASVPPFPGEYSGSWDNPTWTKDNSPIISSAVKQNDSVATTVITPASSNKGCVNWGAIVFSTTVQDSDHDGLMDVWKAPANQGYYDAGSNRGMSNQGTCTLNQGTCLPKAGDPSWVDLSVDSGATPGNKDIFLQVDYMCLANPLDGTANCNPLNGGISYAPDPQTVANLKSAFKTQGINVHVDPNQHAIPALTCVDTVVNGSPVYCPYPGQAGAVGWKLGYSFLKTQPLNYPDETSCETRTPPGGAAGSGPVCLRRFQPGRNNSYHEVIFGVASAVPNWYFQDGSLTDNVAASGNTLTFTTTTTHGLKVDAIAPNGRITIAGAISNPSLNGTYLVQGFPPDANGNPSTTSFTIQLPTATTPPTKSTDPFLSVASGAVIAGSGVSDIGGADSLVTLGLWGADGRAVPVQSGTFMHELGHTLGLTHGGFFRLPPPPGAVGGYTFSFEPNCKSNFQSVMNYLFQVDLLDGALDYSDQVLNLLDEAAGSSSPPNNGLGSPIHPTTKWYGLNPPLGIGNPANSHCDGSPKSPNDPNKTMFRLEGPASSIAWIANQDINYDGKIEPALQGYSDWDNVDLRQIGATGNDFWAGGALPIRTGGGALPIRTGGGALPIRTGGGALPIRTGGGVGEITVQAANSTVRNPTNLIAALVGNTIQLTFTPPGFGQSLIDHFNVYRSVNGAQFSPPAYANVPATQPLPTTVTFTDTKVACATYSYLVTTVLSDGRESVPVPSSATVPISVPCKFVGFLSPLSTAGTISAPTFSGTVNQGSAVPLKWEILDANGNPIGDLSTLKLLQACPTTGSTVPPPSSTVPPCVLLYSPTTGAKGNSTFRFSSPQFIFNWDTASTIGSVAGYFTVELTLNDGSAVKATTIQFH